MTNAAPMTEVEVLRGRYRKLDLVEEEIKGPLRVAEQNLLAVRELKKTIGQQIFNAANARGHRTEIPNAATTPNNGTTKPA